MSEARVVRLAGSGASGGVDWARVAAGTWVLVESRRDQAFAEFENASVYPPSRFDALARYVADLNERAGWCKYRVRVIEHHPEVTAAARPA